MRALHGDGSSLLCSCDAGLPVGSGSRDVELQAADPGAAGAAGQSAAGHEEEGIWGREVERLRGQS